MFKCKCGKECKSKPAYSSHWGQCRVAKGEKWYKEYLEKQRKNQANQNRKKVTQQKKEKELQNWLNSNPFCERCKEPMTEKYASGRFCNVSCANSKANSGPKAKDTRPKNIQCPYCERKFVSKKAIASHIGIQHKIERENDFYKSFSKSKNQEYVLDISYKNVKKYQEKFVNCEICGKSVKSIEKEKNHFKNLCIDHCHETNKFRGLLCMTCNVALGWYEKRLGDIQSYLESNWQEKILE